MSRLARLLHPRSLAVIGGGTWGENVIRQARAFGFRGPIWPVHPTRPTVAGEPALHDISTLPAPPDAAYVAINRHATIDAISVLSRRGAGGAICLASGFREARTESPDATRLHRALLNAAGDMPLLGPNCYGLVNALDGVAIWPDQHGCTPLQAGVAVVTQSSNIAINLTMQRRSVPLAMVVTAGNQAQTGLAEIGAALLADSRITALGLHIEGIGDIRAMEALARTASDLGKPVVALKLGRSHEARSATLTHTASLAGSEAGGSAFLERLGIPHLFDLPQFLETLKLLHVAGPLPGPRIAAMSCSGGEAGLIADLARDNGLSFPPPGPTLIQRLRETLGPMVALANPLDYHTCIWGDRAAMTETFATMLAGPVALGIVTADFPRDDRCDGAAWDCVVEAAIDARKRSDKPLAVAATLAENMPERVAARLLRHGVIPFCGLGNALAAVSAACRATPTPHPRPILLPRPPVRAATLGEADAKQALAAHGLAVPRGHRCARADAPAKARLLTPPLALKAQGIAHKTDAGAVALDLADASAVQAALERMDGDSFLVEEMIPGAVAELLVGVVVDPAHGHVLTLAAGGTLAEVLADSVSQILPVSRRDIARALERLKIAPLLRGYRGRPGADPDAVIDAVMAIQSYVIAMHGRVSEVEVNPLLALPDRAVAVDALIRIGDLE